ncbi:toxic anion resistance protein [uncultured Gulosibacter sp.]|uniref:toxic anion resistance protein n=1 Tax=uncultured Gulosibacter sp. TaxID=1339167 RepID=UPI00288A176E|nr:toxic anion resistance protein [uncultured Gulosibacter sp.]
MNEKLTPPSPTELAPIEASPAVEPVASDAAGGMLPDIDPETALDLRNRANAWVNNISTLKPKTPEYTEQVRAIQEVARTEIRTSANTSQRFLEKSLAQSKAAGGDGHAVEVSRSLADLRNTVEELAPEERKFGSRFLRMLPGGKQVQRYFRKYESNQEQLNTVLLALDRGQDTLRKDNAALGVERKALWESMVQLKKLSGLLTELDNSVVEKIASLQASGEAEAATAMQNDVLFAIRQRHTDVQTQLAVSVQSYLSMDLIQDNNLKLIDGVERAKTTTMTALRTAVVVAQALENQKIVLDQIDAVNNTTNDMIDRTSQMLRDNTARIQEQAVNSGVSLETLQRAYDNVFATIDQVETFRAAANNHFAQTIANLEQQVERANPYLERSRENQLSREGDNSAQRQLDSGNLPPELTI